MSTKTLCFFVQGRPKIIEYCFNFVMSKEARLSIWCPIDNI